MHLLKVSNFWGAFQNLPSFLKDFFLFFYPNFVGKKPVYARVARTIFAPLAQSICRFVSGSIFARMRAIDIRALRERKRILNYLLNIDFNIETMVTTP